MIKLNTTIFTKVKAAVLLLVFGLNTIVGFVCAAGVNMNFNAAHHEEATPKIHVHADGKTHHHEKKGNSHHRKEQKGGCCNDKVVTIAKADKSLPQTVKLFSPVFVTAALPVYNILTSSYTSTVKVSGNYFARNYHPPGPGIRISIRSFQI